MRQTKCLRHIYARYICEIKSTENSIRYCIALESMNFRAYLVNTIFEARYSLSSLFPEIEKLCCTIKRGFSPFMCCVVVALELLSSILELDLRIFNGSLLEDYSWRFFLIECCSHVFKRILGGYTLLICSKYRFMKINTK